MCRIGCGSGGDGIELEFGTNVAGVEGGDIELEEAVGVVREEEPFGLAEGEEVGVDGEGLAVERAGEIASLDPDGVVRAIGQREGFISGCDGGGAGRSTVFAAAATIVGVERRTGPSGQEDVVLVVRCGVGRGEEKDDLRGRRDRSWEG